MNFQELIEAGNYPILSNELGLSSSELHYALQLVKTQHFKDWYATHPNGKWADYMAFRKAQAQAYYNSPQYQIEMLQNKIEEDHQYMHELVKEIKEKDDEIENLSENLSFSRNLSCVLGLISLFLFLFIVRRPIINLYKRIF